MTNVRPLRWRMRALRHIINRLLIKLSSYSLFPLFLTESTHCHCGLNWIFHVGRLSSFSLTPVRYKLSTQLNVCLVFIQQSLITSPVFAMFSFSSKVLPDPMWFVIIFHFPHDSMWQKALNSTPWGRLTCRSLLNWDKFESWTLQSKQKKKKNYQKLAAFINNPLSDNLLGYYNFCIDCCCCCCPFTNSVFDTFMW